MQRASATPAKYGKCLTSFCNRRKRKSIVRGIRRKLENNIKWILEKLKGEKTIRVP
jgi:hypothetical protein